MSHRCLILNWVSSLLTLVASASKAGAMPDFTEIVLIDLYKNMLSHVTLRERFLRPKSLARWNEMLRYAQHDLTKGEQKLNQL